jgi:flavin-dependent dehydrogenase
MKSVKKICITGGGTAGWITAVILRGILERNWLNHQKFEYYVVESPDNPIIGVGEGSTGLLVDIIKNYPNFGCNEQDFIRKTGAGIKVGIRHIGWSSYKDEYFGGLDLPPVGDIFPNHLDYYSAMDIAKTDSTDNVRLNVNLFKNNKVPFMEDNGTLKTVSSGYSYHFDAYKVGEYLKEVATSKGVVHISNTIDKVVKNNNEISKLIFTDGTDLEADFFIDASGFKRVLLNEFDNEWISYSDYNLVNTGLIFRREQDVIQNYTQAHAQEHGWIFSIPTQHKIGNGYMFNRDITNVSDIESKIKELYPDSEIVKEVKFNSGRYKNSWVSNVCGIGLAYSFSEPLEATSIHCTIVQAMMLADYIGEEMSLDKSVQRRYNERVGKLLDDCAEFINIHYKGNRNDSAFWREASSESTSFDNTKYRLQLWKHKFPDANDFDIGFGSFGASLYLPVLSGIGLLKPEDGEKAIKHYDLEEIALARYTNLKDKAYNATKQCISHKQFIKGCVNENY